MPDRFFILLQKELEPFLESWTAHMKNAGYLEHTTAKREDCIQSFHGTLHPILHILRTAPDADFPTILNHFRQNTLFLTETARRHRSRGITDEMFLGCFKTLLHSIEDIARTLDIPDSEKLEGILTLRRFTDAMETVITHEWITRDQQEVHQELVNTNRMLTLNKNKYENIFQVTSDMVFIMTPEGIVTEMNLASCSLFHQSTGIPMWQLLNIDFPDIAAFLSRFPAGEIHELCLPDNKTSVTMVIVPLSRVSLASDGYMVIMTDITCITEQRSRLEQMVQDRTREVLNSEKLYRSLFTSAGDGILVIDHGLNIIKANQRAAEIFALPLQALLQVNCRGIFHPACLDTLQYATRMEEHNVWNGEVIGVSRTGDTFPASITISRTDIDGETLFTLSLRDITRQKALEDHLRAEKRHAEEMNVTLRTVLKTIDSEKEKLELDIAQKVTTQLIPAITKIASEQDKEVRKMYADVLRDQLVGLSSAAMPDGGAKMLKLTRAEVQVSQMIQSGFSSKEIADAMNISFDTVQTHRKNIRKKLGLSGRDINLFSYLNSPSEGE